jgi:hypothetical protein
MVHRSILRFCICAWLLSLYASPLLSLPDADLARLLCLLSAAACGPDHAQRGNEYARAVRWNPSRHRWISFNISSAPGEIRDRIPLELALDAPKRIWVLLLAFALTALAIFG